VRRAARAAVALALSLGATPLAAQEGPPGPWFRAADALVGWQAPTGLDDGGEVARARAFASVSLAHGRDIQNSVGVSLGAGVTRYDFTDGAAEMFGDIRETGLALPIRFEAGARARVILVPTLRFAAESGADLADGQTEGGIGLVVWQLSETLSLGPGLVARASLDDAIEAFPILAIDWQFADRWRLSTGRGVGATRGPGLTLSYAVTDALRLGIAARRESAEFRLDDDGPAPGGIGEDESLPVVATLGWSPNPGIDASAFAGVALDGELTLRDGDGRKLERRGVDPAPVLGGQLTVRF